MSIFTIVPIMILFIFIIILSFIVFSAVKGLLTWSQNNQATRIIAPAVVVSKREYTSRHHHGPNHVGSSSTRYYITFEFEDGKRMEFPVKPRAVGLIAIEDKGRLTYQGTRFLSFEREIN